MSSCASEAQSAHEQFLAGDAGTFGKVLLKLPETAQNSTWQLPVAVWCSAPAGAMQGSVFLMVSPHVSDQFSFVLKTTLGSWWGKHFLI